MLLKRVLLVLVLSLVSVGSVIGDDDVRYYTPRSVDELAQVSAIATTVAAKVRDSVVCIVFEAEGGWMAGSGTLISEDGYIVTAAHVTEKPNKPCKVFLADGTQLEAKSLGLNKAMDCALVKAEGKKLAYVSMGYSSRIEPGEWVINMGHPFGPEIIPFRKPPVRVGRITESTLLRLVCDAPLISGDSGGPMFDLTGKLVGINVSIVLDNAAANNSCPIDLFRYSFEKFKKGEILDRPDMQTILEVNGNVRKAYDLLSSNPSKALQLFKDNIAIDPNNPELSYHLACAYLRLAQNSQRDDVRDNLITSGLDALKTAVNLGYNDINQMLVDADMNIVRINDTYRALVIRIQRRLNMDGYIGLRLDKNKADLVVSSIIVNESAERGGIQIGDIIVAVEGQSAMDQTSFMSFIKSKRAGDIIRLVVNRVGREFVIDVTLSGKAGTVVSGSNFRSGEVVKKIVRPNVEEALRATVEILKDNVIIGQGVVVRADGMILCKNSDLGNGEALAVKIKEAKFIATKVSETNVTDLAIIKVNVVDLPVIRFGGDDQKEGTLVVSGLNCGIGAISLWKYYARLSNQLPFLGILADQVEGGLKITKVEPKSPADVAQLAIDDIVTFVEGKKMIRTQDLLDIIGNSEPGDTINVVVNRGPKIITNRIKLGNQALSRSADNRSGNPFLQSVLGPYSKRFTGFGLVFVHDTIIKPNECGSPVCDINGNVIGINISRFHRTMTFALHVRTVKPVIAMMLQFVDDHPEDF